MISETEAVERVRVVHLRPGDGGWMLLGDDEQLPREVFSDLGMALDAAVGGPEQVRVVVHERDAAA